MILFGFILSVAYVPGWTGAYIPTGWAVLSLVLAFTLWRPAPIGPLHWVGLLFVAYAFISTLYTVSRPEAGWQLWQIVIMALAFRWGSSLGRVWTMRELYTGLAVGIWVSTAVGVAQALGYQPVLYNEGGVSPTGLFYNSVTFGEVSALVAVCLASEGAWLLALSLLPAIALAHSRGSWLMLGLMALIVVSRRTWPALVAIVLCAGFLLWHPGDSDTMRLNLWSHAFSGLTFFGHGAGSFASLYFVQPSGALFHPIYVHNDYLDLVYQFGLGAAALLWVLITLAWKERYEPEWYPFIAVGILALYSFPLQMPLTCFLFAICAGRLSRRFGLASVERHRSRPLSLPWPLCYSHLPIPVQFRDPFRLHRRSS